jgi:hypothetical protein
MRIVCIPNRSSLKLHMSASEEFPLTKNNKLKESHFGRFQIEIAAQQDTLYSDNHRFYTILGTVELNAGGVCFRILQTHLIVRSLRE